MADEAVERKESVGLNRAGLVAAALEIAGVAVPLLIIAWGVVDLVTQSSAGAMSGTLLLRDAAFMLTSVAAGVFLWASADVVRKLDDARALYQELQMRSGAVSSAQMVSPNTGNSAMTAEALQELTELMRELRDISLLPESQRAARLELVAHELEQRLEVEVPELLRGHGWFEAAKRVRDARERFPGNPAWDRLSKQIDEVSSKVEQQDIEAAKRQIEELASLGAWERAQDVIRDLLERHPRAEAAHVMSRQLQQRRRKAEAEMLAKLMSQAQEHVSRREWHDALVIAKSIIQRFPNSAEAKELRQQVHTLEANVEIRARQQMENTFRELLKQNRYAQAMQLARQLIERFPTSPQAQILRDQLPKLQQKLDKSSARA
jgi:outer membrane protein assembly factor BamD (BamD/ComL family)